MFHKVTEIIKQTLNFKLSKKIDLYQLALNKIGLNFSLILKNLISKGEANG